MHWTSSFNKFSLKWFLDCIQLFSCRGGLRVSGMCRRCDGWGVCPLRGWNLSDWIRSAKAARSPWLGGHRAWDPCCGATRIAPHVSILCFTFFFPSNIFTSFWNLKNKFDWKLENFSQQSNALTYAMILEVAKRKAAAIYIYILYIYTFVYNGIWISIEQ